MHNYMSIDVEDYFQVAAFERLIDPDTWDSYPPRVEHNTRRILDLFDAHGIKATFFIVGWTAKRCPAMVRDIALRGHDIGCHSYRHQKIYTQTPEEFRQDTKRAKDILEEIIGRPVLGYRAPTYSITKTSLWALPILKDLGFTWDSSIFPVVHDNYGIPDAPRFEYDMPEYGLKEYPISTARFFGYKLPVAGGGYFRLFPYWFTKYVLRRINTQDKKPFVFYLHPWEIDPGQPRIATAGRKSRFRHYNNLEKTEGRLQRLLRDFQFQPIPG